MTNRSDGPGETAAPDNNGGRGAIIRIFGVILVILGTLNTMLAWRGGFTVVPFQAMLIAVGLLLCLIGAIRSQNRH